MDWITNVVIARRFMRPLKNPEFRLVVIPEDCYRESIIDDIIHGSPIKTSGMTPKKTSSAILFIDAFAKAEK